MGGLKMARIASAIAVAAVLFAGGTAHGRFIIGVGISSCGSWTQARQTPRKDLAIIQWVFGYISSANTFAPRFVGNEEVAPLPDYIEGLDADALTASVDNYCREHPLDQISDAAKNLVMELELRTLR
jgi:hypothetical protein